MVRGCFVIRKFKRAYKGHNVEVFEFMYKRRDNHQWF